MIPTKAKFLNWCQHEELEIVLVQGMNMIRGANGSGKSNLIDGLLMALTCESNNVLHKADRKTDNIMSGEDKAQVLLEFEHEGVPGWVRVDLSRNYRVDADVLNRQIEHAKAQVAANGQGDEAEISDEILRLCNFTPRETVKMRLNWGDEKLNTQTKALGWLSKIVGLSPKAVKDTFFPAQGNVDALISGDPDARYRSLADQAGTTICATVYRLLGDEISAQPSFEGVEETHREAQAELANAQRQLTEAEKAWKKVEGKKKDPEPLREVINRYQQANSARERQAENTTKKASLEGQLAEQLEKVNQVKERGQEVRKQHDEAEKAVEQARKITAKYDEQQSILRRREETTRAIEEVTEQLANQPPMPERPEEAAKIDELNQELAGLQPKIKQRQEWVKTFADGVCPTCGFDGECRNCGCKVMDFSEKLKGYQDELIDMAGRDKQLTGELLKARSVADEYETLLEAWRTMDANLRARQVTLEEQLKGLPEVPEDLVPEELAAEAGGALAKFQALRTELEEQQNLYRSEMVVYNRINNDLEVVKGLLEAAAKDVEGSPTEEEFKKASDAYSEFQLVEQKIRDADRDLTEARTVFEMAVEKEQKWQEKLDKVRPTREWLGLLGATRDLYHKNGPPRDAVLWYANRLIEHTNSYLQHFDGHFTMSMGDDMSFIAFFDCGKIMPSARLSGGEKNMLNIGLRFAYADLYPSAFRFLELDEVEVHLDQENTARLSYVLEKAKTLARDRGLVVVFISHDPTLSELADHVTEL